MTWVRRNEVATGMSKRSANRISAALAASDQRLPPAMTIGRSAAASSCRMRSISAAPGEVSIGSNAGTSATVARSSSMSSGSATTTGPGPAVGGGVERARDQLRNARRIVDLGHPFGDRAEHRAVVELLERLAVAHVAPDLADEQDHRRRVLSGNMQAGRRIGGAGPAGDEADAGPAGRLADRLRHHRGAALLAAHRQFDRTAIHAVERGDVALARHAEHMAHAMDDELIGEDFAACPHAVAATH